MFFSSTRPRPARVYLAWLCSTMHDTMHDKVYLGGILPPPPVWCMTWYAVLCCAVLGRLQGERLNPSVSPNVRIRKARENRKCNSGYSLRPPAPRLINCWLQKRQASDLLSKALGTTPHAPPGGGERTPRRRGFWSLRPVWGPGPGHTHPVRVLASSVLSI